MKMAVIQRGDIPHYSYIPLVIQIHASQEGRVRVPSSFQSGPTHPQMQDIVTRYPSERICIGSGCHRGTEGNLLVSWTAKS